jgi:hypothetical protein
MTGPRCRRDNEADAAFCIECGARLEHLCARCQTANASAARFCKRCGQALAPPPSPTPPEFATPRSYIPKHLAEKILVSRSALEGERKQVSVLFVLAPEVMPLLEKARSEDAELQPSQRLRDRQRRGPGRQRLVQLA